MITFPEHKASLTLDHNTHKNYYKTAAQQIDEWNVGNNGPDWKDQDARDRAIATDEIWTLQWYPHTPIGFEWIAAPTLEELMEYAASYDG